MVLEDYTRCAEALPNRLVLQNLAIAITPPTVVALPRTVGARVRSSRLSKAETRILEQYWKLGTASVREILESLPEDERVAYTTVQTLVYRLEEKGALRKVKKIGNAQLFQPAIDQSQHRGRLVRDLLDLFGGSPRLLVSNLLENGTLTLRDLKALQNASSSDSSRRTRGGKRA
jgi:BlaI family transcriptional regulator, penicillinase repressor